MPSEKKSSQRPKSKNRSSDRKPKTTKKSSAGHKGSDVSVIVEQSDNPIENYDKVHQPSKVRPWAKAKAGAKSKVTSPTAKVNAGEILEDDEGKGD